MNQKTKILYAEDEISLGLIVKESLETRDFEVLFAADGQKAYEIYKNEQPELLVLDVMMPKKDGFTLAKEIRKENPHIPILFLTAKTQTKDVVEGFELGGNDYLKKPFSIEELIVRIRSLLKHKNLSSKIETIAIGNYQFNHTNQVLIIEQEEIKLTHRESELLFYLAKHSNELLDRSFILNKIWGNDDFFNARSMDVFITKLRKKLKKDPTIQILNIRGYGYKLVCS